jgi:uncharacterized protein (TIGR02594 family)
MGAFHPGTVEPTAPAEPNWLTVARKELGVHETAGSKATARIVEYDAATTLKATSDEVPWCSAFANWCMQQVGQKRTMNGMARSWLTWGRTITRPQLGCVVVFWRGSEHGSEGHVAFWLGEDNRGVRCLGGNQSDSVCIAYEPKARVLGYRMPA